MSFPDKYRYTKRWFLDSELYRLAHKYLTNNVENHFLEIGCYEGLSSFFLADHFLGDKKASLVCVDPFSTEDTTTPLTNETQKLFYHNLSCCDFTSQIQIYEEYSRDFYKRELKEKYNFVYVDGSHVPEDITLDMEQCFQRLVPGGIMWMDDYLGADGRSIKDTMDKFVSKYQDQLEVIHSGYQLAIRKK